ncbi:MAG: peptidoglycan-binding protein [Patescibacteria group bacterium]|nr:peptidoglycan-binding protein [Patescibacteria group bacterium]
MKRKAIFGVSLVCIIFVITFFVVVKKIGNFSGFISDSLSAIGIQGADSTANNTSKGTAQTLTIADALGQLENQIQSENTQLADLSSQIEIINLRNIFKRNLKLGDKGDDVSKLQELLIQFPDIYSSDTVTLDKVTGLYDTVTKTVVKQFQSQSGLTETGVFDSTTREKFYESMIELDQENATTTFEPIDISSIPDLQNQTSQTDTNGIPTNTTDIQNQISQLYSDIATVQSQIVDLQSQSSGIQSLPLPSTTSTPLAPKLAISNVGVTNIAQKSATVIWTTNVASTSEVDYSTDVSLPTGNTTTVNGLSATTSHIVNLSNLNIATKYYYKVISKDSTNSIINSNIQSFSTIH